jgi:hypothetical protein
MIGVALRRMSAALHLERSGEVVGDIKSLRNRRRIAAEPRYERRSPSGSRG